MTEQTERYPNTELQPYQYELSVLAEECGEVVQIAGKILRFGWDSYSPLDKDRITNADLLHSEVADFLAGVDFAVERGMLDREKLLTRQFSKRKRLLAMAPQVIQLNGGIEPAVRTEYQQPRTLHLFFAILFGIALVGAAFYAGRTSNQAETKPQAQTTTQVVPPSTKDPLLWHPAVDEGKKPAD